MKSVLALSVESLRVIVRIDGVDISRADGNGGVDPWHVLVPVNRFVATGEPTSALIACCPSCGPDCVAVEARIRREGDAVRWEWSGRATLFDAEAYDAEVSRLDAERDWETPERRAGRLILADLALPPGLEGLRVSVRSAGELEVWLEAPGEYQIFVRAPWDENQPDKSATAIRAVLAGPPPQWPAEWHAIKADQETPPPYAGPSWRRLDLS
ncbi:hypothetical protein [Paractinoplanes lichenicola]|uniref:Uncharacterized protein n=1 Tax=Paractinoplanes lichenicola TaxID=2802976 RepID=A0ABS1W4M9_9ACTN|nr:hypothetical protein [Actinoplanes lichenicola]MBL7261695.1 hypothetical protein [Actinoplanes lichenicola]